MLSADRAPLQRLKLGVLDTFFHLKTPPSYNPNIIVIEINDENIDKIGRWPWSREWHAALIYALEGMGARYIFFDIVFSERSPAEEDKIFSDAIKRSGNVYLPFVFPEDLINIDKAIKPLKEFSDLAKDTGSINISPDIDGTLRKVPLFFKEGDKIHYHIAMKMAMDYIGAKIDKIDRGSVTISNSYKKIKIPLLDRNQMLINWSGGWVDTFRHFSFLSVLAAYKAIEDGEKPDIDIEKFKNSICLIGITAVGLYDIKSVPLEPEYPAIGVFASVLSNIMDERFIRTSPNWISWLFIFFLAFLPALSVSGERPLREVAIALLYAPLFFTVSFLLFRLGLWIDCSLPLLAFFASYSAVTIYDFMHVSIEKQRFFAMSMIDDLTNLYNIRYFKALLKKECQSAVHEMDKKFCIILVDIDYFKRINDMFGHKAGDFILRDVADLLKESVRSTDVVARYGGEEMLILLRGAMLDTGLLFAEKARKAIENRIVKDGDKTHSMTISLGVASFKERDTEESMIKRADEGLYKAKNSGRNRVGTVETT